MNDLLTNVKKINWLLRQSPTGAISFNGMCEVLSDMLKANVYVVNLEGKVIGVGYKVRTDSSTITDPQTGEEHFPKEYNEEFMKFPSTVANISGDKVLEIFKFDYDTTDKIHTVIPIIGGGRRWGTMILVRYDPEFTEEEVVLGECGASVIGLEIQQRKSEEEKAEERELSMVRMAMGTLSYSEVEAVRQIFAELEGDEGLLVASKIADRSGITRSVIVNALRKLESAGVIESRSLGMKGTRIKILNSKFKDELAELKDL